MQQPLFYTPDNWPKQQFPSAAVTVGMFDGVHIGHQALLQQLQTLSNHTVVVTFDPHPRQVLQPHLPQPQLLTPLPEKATRLKKIGITNVIVIPFTRAFAETTAPDYIRYLFYELIHTGHVLIGYDHRFGKNRAGGISELQTMGAKLGFTAQVFPAFTDNDTDQIPVSSTRIRNAIMQRQLSLATRLLGRYYSLRGTVIEGKKLGRTIGYPTANLQPIHSRQLLPGLGVYAVKVKLAANPDHTFDAILNYGLRPTVDTAAAAPVIEVHIFDFQQDLYGQELEVFFVECLRLEKKFDSLSSLIDQLDADSRQARQLLAAIHL